MISLADAADLVGISKSTMLRNIKKGKVSAFKNENGGFEIDESELHRVWPDAAKSTSLKHQDDTIHQVDARYELEIFKLKLELDAAKEKSLKLTDEITDAKKERDEWRKQAQQLLLTKSSNNSESKSFWSRFTYKNK